MSRRASALVATLGSEPQVVTLVLDCLHRMGERITHVMVLHTDLAYPPLHQSLITLEELFGPHSPYQPCPHFMAAPFKLDGSPINDITTREEALAVLRTTYQKIAALKDNNYRVHLSPAGGRKAMAMYAMLVAQILFDEDDRLWLLISKDALRLERRLHARPGEASIARVPVLPWRLDLTEKQAFLREHLTPAEADVLEQVARYGLTDREIAARRGTTAKTVGHQLSTVYQKLSDSLGHEGNERMVDRHTLVAEFNAFFEVVDALETGSG